MVKGVDREFCLVGDGWIIKLYRYYFLDLAIFLAAGFFVADFFATGFIVADFLAAGFFVANFLATGFIVADFLAAGFLAAFSFFCFASGVGLQSSSRFADNRPQELQAYFKLTSLGVQMCLGSPVIVSQDLHTYAFDAMTGLQRCPLSVVAKPHDPQL